MVDTIYIEKQVRNHTRTKQIVARYPKAQLIDCERYSEIFNLRAQNFRLQKQNPSLILAGKHKAHVLEAPAGYGVGGDKNYYFSYMLNCVYDCRYCFLQGMYQSAHYVVFVNYEDFTDSIVQLSADPQHEQVWFFSGYDCDSLAFEPVTGFIEHCLQTFENIPNAWLEIRTKSTQIRNLLNRQALDNVVVAFSFTPDDFSKRYENGVAGVSKRIRAMATLQQAGWKIGLRFDPMLAYKNYQSSYRTLFEQIFTSLDPEKIHSASMGEFRMPKGFFKNIKAQYPQEPLFHLPMDDLNGMKSFDLAIEQNMFDYCQRLLLQWLPENKLFSCSI